MPSDEDKVRALAECVAAKRAQKVDVIESCYSRVVSSAHEGHGTRIGPESLDIILALPRQGTDSGDTHEVFQWLLPKSRSLRVFTLTQLVLFIMNR